MGISMDFVVTDYTAINGVIPHGFALEEQHATGNAR